MLKIRLEVDLKELEKFGFVYCKSIRCYEKMPKYDLIQAGLVEKE